VARFRSYTLAVLAVMLAVILWGAYVRASGAGAGCGAHWPLCNGEVMPSSPARDTLIELTHRVTSSALGIMIFVQLWLAFRLFPAGSIVRRAAVFSTLFVLSEGLVGGVIVLLKHVAHNQSAGRAFTVTLHLANTFMLVASQVLLAWWAAGNSPPRFDRHRREQKLIAAGLVLLLVVGCTGAVTALGDTLFRSTSLLEGMSEDFQEGAHMLKRLRIFHPIAAVTTAAYLFFLSLFGVPRDASATPRKVGSALAIVVGVQVLFGFVNLALLAPTWMQMGHLLLADSVWMLVIVLGASVLGDPGNETSPNDLGQPSTSESTSASDLAGRSASMRSPLSRIHRRNSSRLAPSRSVTRVSRPIGNARSTSAQPDRSALVRTSHTRDAPTLAMAPTRPSCATFPSAITTTRVQSESSRSSLVSASTIVDPFDAASASAITAAEATEPVMLRNGPSSTTSRGFPCKTDPSSMHRRWPSGSSDSLRFAVSATKRCCHFFVHASTSGEASPRSF
jgi:heme A synthase